MIPAKTPASQRPLLIALLALVALLLQAGVPPARAQAGQTITVANGDVAGLVAAIEKLNANGGGTIDLASDGTYSVTAPSDWWYGPNAFPAIASPITVNGNGATISREAGSPKFRFFFVSSGFSTLPAGALTLNNLTLTGGLAQGGSGGLGEAGGGGGAGLGGAIYNLGTLTLSSVAFASNTAQGGSPGSGDPSLYTTGAGGGLGGDGASALQKPQSAGPGGGGFKGNGTIPSAVGSSGIAYGSSGGSFLGNEGGTGGCTSTGASSYGGNGGIAGGGTGGGGGGGGFTPGENGGIPAYGANDVPQVSGGSAAQGGRTGG